MPFTRAFSILVLGAFSSGKTTLIRTISDNVNAVLTRQHHPSALPWGCCGQVHLDDELLLLLYEMPYFRNVLELAGEFIGALLVVDNQFPETFREAASLISLRAYLPLPIIVVANPHRPDVPEVPLTELRDALNLDDDIPIVACNVRDREAVKSVLRRLVELGIEPTDEDGEKLLPTPTVIHESLHFDAQHQHQFLMVVSTHWSNLAHYIMDRLAEQDAWIVFDNPPALRRWGYCDLEQDVRLHIIPREFYAMPSNRVQFAVQSLLAMVEGHEQPNPIAEENLNLNESVIGCIGLFRTSDTVDIARAQQMVKAFGMYPSVLIWVQDKVPGEKPIELSTNTTPPFETHFPVLTFPDLKELDRAVIIEALCRQLDADKAALLRQKFIS
jgi:signal recognition particle receptor subunit beta